jgi:hypothetical protein
MEYLITKMNRRTILLAVGLLSVASPLLASEVLFDGARFEKLRTIDGITVICNGVGKRTILFFDAYHIALYVHAHYSNFDMLRQSKQPRILELRLLRDAPLTLLEKVLIDGVRKNAEPDMLLGLQERLQTLLINMRRVDSLAKGDVLEIIFSGDATQLRVNKVDVGKPIFGKDFNDALLSIWMGIHPIDGRLKRNLLGIE